MLTQVKNICTVDQYIGMKLKSFSDHRKFKQLTAFLESEVLVIPSSSATTHRMSP